MKSDKLICNNRFFNLQIFFMKKIFLLAVTLIIIIFISCKKYDQFHRIEYGTTGNGNNSGGSENSGHIKIAVISDIHYLDPSLLQNNAVQGTAFRNFVIGSPHKVLAEYGPAIFNKVISDLIYEKPDVVLVAGDLALEGEKVSHQAVAGYLNQLRQGGIKVYVTPGNNDINNPDARAYDGNNSLVTPKVTPSEFASIYSNFGYGNAFSKDPNSLSYIAEAYPNLWVLSIDAAKYYPTYRRSGRILPETMQWIKQQMAVANQNDITVLGLMHHNLIEHFSGQNQVTGSTVIDDWTARADSLIAWGLKLMFTGHSHVTDITARVTNGKSLYDIETGSLITPPASYRLMILKNKELEITTNKITSINESFPGNLSFTDYSNQSLASNLDLFFTSYLTRSPFSLSSLLAQSTAPVARNAWMAHIAGDENISPLEQAKIDSLNLVIPTPTFAIWAVNTLWTDIGIKDNKWHIKLTDP